MEDIIVKRHTANLGMSRKEVIQVISELILKSCLFKQIITWTTSFEAADTFEKSWKGGCRSGNDYRTITDLCVTIVSLSHDD